MTWIVAINRPYYPSVDEFETYEEAQAALNEFVKDEHSEGGAYSCKVYIAEVWDVANIRTHY